MTTEPFADQQPATSTSQPAHWHVFADGPGTGPGFVFGGSTDALLDEDGALALADKLIAQGLAEHCRLWNTFWVCRCPADTGCALDEDGACDAFDLATVRPYWTWADDDAAQAAQAADNARLALIPTPPGVTGDPTDWYWDGDLDGYVRYLTMGRWDVGGDESGGIRARVGLLVLQTESGALRDWSIDLGTFGDEMTADDARRLASALLEAATALEASRPA
jgi:hypothetical protein